MSDLVAITLQAGGFLALMLARVFVPRDRSLAVYAVVLGIVVNLVLWLPQGGPELWFGFFVHTGFYAVALLVGRAIRHVLVGFNVLREPVPDGEPRCGGCGYNLTGLTSPRCPECGRHLTAAEKQGDPHILRAPRRSDTRADHD